MNWGTMITWAGVALNVGSSIGFFAVKDMRRGLYFLCAAAITTTVNWPQ